MVASDRNPAGGRPEEDYLIWRSGEAMTEAMSKGRAGEKATGVQGNRASKRAVASKLREAGVKPTPQRVAIYEMLASTTAHPRVETVYEALKGEFPAMSLNTVYCALQALVGAGLVRKLAMRENIYRYDANAAPHAHFVCVRCGRVEDLGGIVDEALGRIEPALASKIQRRVVDREHHFYGYCHGCEAELTRRDAADGGGTQET